jgi:hypothetical protein
VPPKLVLGPLLRYVGETEATLWVETDSPCEVEVLGATERTFQVEGHHYGLVKPQGLEPGAWHEYEVRLDGELAWPEPDSPFPRSRFRTYPKDDPTEVLFGSCRVTAPHHPPYTLTQDEDPRGFETDALYALAREILDNGRDLPDLLLMLGDQMYADEVSPATEVFLESRRNPDDRPGDQVYDFEEYTHLYREAWGEPTIRWLLSTVSTAMVFDDHDIHDDWNISAAWLEDARATGWWEEHIVAGLASYWIYQHLGNLPPDEHSEDELLERVRQADDAWPLLAEFAAQADRDTSGSCWSYCRDVGSTRLIVIDSRAGRVLDEGGRSMVDAGEWDFIEEHAQGGFDHLLIATSLPFLLAPAMHNAEAWSEAVCAGAWGPVAARLGEKLRRSVDLEHWAAFGTSFEALAELQRSVAAGERGEPPATVVTLSGDVHHSYLFEARFPPDAGVRSAIWQATCSPFRNPLSKKERRQVKLASTRPAEWITRALARAAGVPEPPFSWTNAADGAVFDNILGGLRIDGRRLDLRIEKALPSQRLEPVLERRLA